MAVCLDKNILIIILNNGHYIVMDARNLIEYQDNKRNNRNNMIPMNKTKNADRIITSFKPPYYRFAILSKKNIFLIMINQIKIIYLFVK